MILLVEQGKDVRGAIAKLYKNVSDFNKHQNEVSHFFTGQQGLCKIKKKLKGRLNGLTDYKSISTNLFDSDKRIFLEESKLNKLIIAIE